MGYSFSDSAQFIGAMNKSGQDSGKIMQGMNTAASKLAKEGVKDIPSALGDAQKAIVGASDDTSALQLAVQTFGSRGAPAMVQALRHGGLNDALAEMAKASDNSNDSIKKTGAQTQTLSGNLSKLRNASEVALQPLSSAVFRGVTDGLIGITQALTGVVNWLSDSLPNAIGHSVNAFKDFYDAISPLRDIIGQTFLTAARVVNDAWHVVEPVMRAMIDIFKVVGDLLTGNWTGAWNAGKDAALSAVRALSAIPKLLYDYVTAPFAALSSGVSNALGNFWSMISAIPSRIVSELSGMGSQLFNAGKALMEEVGKGIVAGIEAPVKAITSGFDKLKSLIPHSPAQSGPFSGSGWTSLATGGAAIMEQIATGMDSVPLSLPSLSVPSATGGTTAAGARGPAVVIQQAVFSSGIDVDQFMKRVAWMTQTAGV